MSAERLVQEAVYAALVADAPFMALVNGVFDDEADEGTAYPYTILGETTEAESRCHDVDGYEVTLLVHDWSDYEGRRECQLIREARNLVLHNVTLTVTGWSATRTMYEWGTILREFDESLRKWVRHQVTRYRIHTGAP